MSPLFNISVFVLLFKCKKSFFPPESHFKVQNGRTRVSVQQKSKRNTFAVSRVLSRASMTSFISEHSFSTGITAKR